MGARPGYKHRKHGRNKSFCEVYKSLGTREKNKERKKVRHLKRVAKKRIKLARRAA